MNKFKKTADKIYMKIASERTTEAFGFTYLSYSTAKAFSRGTFSSAAGVN